jgi:hypothetical protein
MRNITANAMINLKEQPTTLYVHGSIMTYSANDKVVVTKANPQGINTSILVLDLEVISVPGPMKGTPKPFTYENSTPEATNYSQVTIRYSSEASITINVEIFG